MTTVPIFVSYLGQFHFESVSSALLILQFFLIVLAWFSNEKSIFGNTKLQFFVHNRLEFLIYSSKLHFLHKRVSTIVYKSAQKSLEYVSLIKTDELILSEIVKLFTTYKHLFIS